MRQLIKTLAWPIWWAWVRIVFGWCLVRALLFELEQERVQRGEVKTELEVHYLRQAIRTRWGWSEPPSPVETYLRRAAAKRTRELSHD